MEAEEETGYLFANVHEKGDKRGVSIYLGNEEVEILKNQGIRIRDEKKFLVKTEGNSIRLVPISALDKKANWGVLFEIMSRLDDLEDLEDEKKEDLCVDLLEVITRNEINIDARERSAIVQLIKGHFTRHVLRTALQVCIKADPEETFRIINRLVSNKKR